jgi:hypothetical protein
MLIEFNLEKWVFVLYWTLSIGAYLDNIQHNYGVLYSAEFKQETDQQSTPGNHEVILTCKCVRFSGLQKWKLNSFKNYLERMEIS